MFPSLGQLNEVEGRHREGVAEDADDDAAAPGLLAASTGLDLDVEEDLVGDGVVAGGCEAGEGEEGGDEEERHCKAVSASGGEEREYWWPTWEGRKE